jgi:hypothetical protein
MNRGSRATRTPAKSSTPAPTTKTVTVRVPRQVFERSNSPLPDNPSQIPVNDSARHLEAEADRVANRVTNPSAAAPLQSASTSLHPHPSETLAAPLHSALGSGRALDADTRSFMEKRFGDDFSSVRIHTGDRAAASAQSLQARAYALGNDLVFGTPNFDPSTNAGRQLLAHELAHVVQHRHAPQNRGQIHRKLIASGDAGGFAAFANSVIAVQFKVVVAASGEVSIQSTNVQGPPTREATELVKALQTSINDPHIITMEFIHGQTSTRAGDENVLGGNYQLSRVDLDDLSALGTQEAGVSEGRTGGSVLVHEVTEQFRKQVHGEGFAAAHAVATGAEEAAIGATRGAERFRQVNPTTLEVTIPYTYPDGHIVEVTWDIVNGNYGNVRRKVIPPPAAAAAHHP